MGFATETDELLGTRVRADAGGADYLLESKLGVGGTAAAYLAQRISATGRAPAVIKVILPRIVERQGATAAAVFLKEAVALGRLNERSPPTPFVLRLLDVGRAQVPWLSGKVEVPWLALEYVSGGVEGTTLSERVLRSVEVTGFAFDRERAARAVRHISAGLEEVHAVGVIHRDLTPRNVLCCNAASEEMFKISDFGIARPSGVAVTFGTAVVGTPGYMAPEQIFSSKSSIASDVFSLACLTYFVLTGEEYLPSAGAAADLAASMSNLRPKLSQAKALCPELREDPDACLILDEWLARATTPEPEQRPNSARVFAAAVLPSLRQTSSRSSGRHRSLLRVQLAQSLPPMDWVVRHPPGDTISVHSAGWDGDGRCLAVTDAGLRYWDGCAWSAASLEGVDLRRAPLFARRVGAGRWICGGAEATLFEYSSHGVSRSLRGKESQLSFLDASGSLDEILVVVAQGASGSPSLLAQAGGYWLKALTLPHALAINSLTQVSDERWLVVGRGSDGCGFASLYSPLEWSLEPIPAPAIRAYLASAARRERDVSLAVGTEGTIVRLARGVATTTQLEGEPTLVSAAIDVLDREWVGGVSGLWASAGGANWVRVWNDPSWARPFISIHADVTSVLAMTADGGVLECRSRISNRSIRG